MGKKSKTKKQPAVLVYVIKNNKVLLAKKVRKIFVDCYTGFGGKIEKGESVLAAAQRELAQESGLNVDIESFSKVALIDFYNPKGDIWRVHVFVVTKYKGVPKSTAEMRDPKWFAVSQLQFEKMISSDEYWLPLILRGKKIRGIVHVDPLKVTIKNLK